MIKDMFKRLVAGVVGAGVAVVGSVAFAAYSAQDYTSIGTNIGSEITAVVPVALGVVALTIGIPIAVRVLKRIAH